MSIRLSLFLVAVLFQACGQSDDQSPEPTTGLSALSLDTFVDTLSIVAVAAHRGFHKEVPENSIESMLAAVALGIEFVELDVRTTQDGVPILMHDGTINRTTNGTGSVNSLSYAQLSGFMLKNPNGSTSDIPIPTLEQVLRQARGRIFINLDVKDNNYEGVLDVLGSCDCSGQVILLTQTRDLFDQIIAPAGLRALALCTNQSQLQDYLAHRQATVLNLSQAVFNKPNTDLIRQGSKISWRGILGSLDDQLLAGQTGSLNTAIANAPDILHTDYPELLLSHLKSRGLR